MLNNLDAKTTIQGDGYLYSDKLNLKVFETTVNAIPKHKKSNKAIGNLKHQIFTSYKNFNIGFFQNKHINVNINDGFVKTWFNLNQDFTKLLNTSTIGAALEDLDIKADFNSYDVCGIFLNKEFKLNKSNTLSIYTNILKGNDIQDIQINGQNKNSNFNLAIDYIYAKRNIITKNKDHNSDYTSYGYSIDLHHNFKYKKLNITSEIYNILSYLVWKNIAYMRYDFNSDTIYLGDDGYNHLRPFGRGKYLYTKDYKHTLPLHYKIDFQYNLYKNFSAGFKIIGNEEINMQQIFTKVKHENINYEIGYINKANLATIAFSNDKYKIEFSNKFGANNLASIFSYNMDISKN
jgi:hypothetical protein